MLSYKEIQALNKERLTVEDCEILHSKYGCEFLIEDGELKEIITPFSEQIKGFVRDLYE